MFKRSSKIGRIKSKIGYYPVTQSPGYTTTKRTYLQLVLCPQGHQLVHDVLGHLLIHHFQFPRRLLVFLRVLEHLRFLLVLVVLVFLVYLVNHQNHLVQRLQLCLLLRLVQLILLLLNFPKINS